MLPVILTGVVFVAFVAILLGLAALSGAFSSQGEYRGTLCPDGGPEAVVTLEPVSNGSGASIRSCSNWPERQNCNRPACLRYMSRAGVAG